MAFELDDATIVSLHYAFDGIRPNGEILYVDYDHFVTMEDLKGFFGDNDSNYDVDDKDFIDYLKDKYYYVAMRICR